ncbi:PDR/VanB family oxidoreductase [Bradyrhizobium sp. CIAT3101]|uniref:PDR/VanB family oxidoreductase n=1 Tax=Bradyrhizobium sp. CIAT3101 TaxID=439387 RepID=UPI0024B0DA10|nr:PDR/VanB family oxidoreductase [Bradyrhizobium sp. CIAT3101]WFU80629.1 PDR/VanB family oxidoreductase [Bradyrhizobium sp. CIAT3101]
MAKPTEPISACLRATRDLTPDVRLFEIEPDSPLVNVGPGSHIDALVPTDGRPQLRSYSLAGSCADGLYRIAVKRLASSRGGSIGMWRLKAGERLTIFKPKNSFELSYDRPDYLLLAGGIGITPIYTMALALKQAGANFRLLYAARSRRDLAFADELATSIGERLQLFVSEEGQRIDIGGEIAQLDARGELYVCGPFGMLEAAKQLWSQSGRPAAHLRYETFGNAGRLAGAPFKIRVPRLGLEIDVPVNRSMLEALEDAGVDMIFGCRRGECGLCVLPILEASAEVDHRDVFFGIEERAMISRICTCVSRAASGFLTIDTPDRTPNQRLSQRLSVQAGGLHKIRE